MKTSPLMETTARPGVGSTPILAHRSILMVGCRALDSIPYMIHFYIMLEIEQWPLFSEQRASCHPKEPKGISVRTVAYTSSLSLVFEKGRHTQGNICTTKQKESRRPISWLLQKLTWPGKTVPDWSQDILSWLLFPNPVETYSSVKKNE